MVVLTFGPEDEKLPPAPAATSPAGGGGPLTFEPEKKPGIISDVVQSAGAGLRQGIEGLPGLPQDILNLGGAGLGWLSQKFGASPETAQSIRDWSDVPYLPSTADIHAATTPYIGESYQPQTTAGKFARSISEFAPGMITGPGSLLRKGVQTVAGGAGSEAAREAFEGTQYEPWAAAAGGLAGAGIGGLRKPTLSADEIVQQEKLRKFGVEPTKGQLTGDIAQQMAEEQMHKGAKGPWAQRLMENRNKSNKEAMEASGLSLRDTMAPGRGADTADSADILNWSTRRYVRNLKEEGAKQIDEALKSGVWIDNSKFANLKGHMANALEGQGKGTGVPEFVVDSLTPSAATAVERINKFVESVPKNAEVNLAGAEQLRRQIGTIKATDPNDIRVLGAVRRAYDEWMEDAVNTGVRRVGNGQLPGPGVPNTTDDVLAGLKEGRGKYSKAMELERPKKGPGSQQVKSIATEGEMGANTPEKTMRFFTPDNNGNMKAEAAPALERLQKHFAPDSPEMAQVKDMVLSQLTQGDAGRIATRVDNFINKNPTVAQKLFSQQELDQLRDWGSANRRMVPNKAATNPSQSSYGIINAIKNKSSGAGTVVGTLLGGPVGTVIGGGIDLAVKGLPTVMGAREAKSALSPTRESLAELMAPGIKGAKGPAARDLLYSVNAPGEENDGMQVKLAPNQPEDSNFVRVIRPDGKEQLIGKNLLKGAQ